MARSGRVPSLSSVLRDVDRKLVTSIANNLVLSLEKQIGFTGVIAGLESAEASPVVAIQVHLYLNDLAGCD